jgi:hypothetical protein
VLCALQLDMLLLCRLRRGVHVFEVHDCAHLIRAHNAAAHALHPSIVYNAFFCHSALQGLRSYTTGVHVLLVSFWGKMLPNARFGLVSSAACAHSSNALVDPLVNLKCCHIAASVWL